MESTDGGGNMRSSMAPDEDLAPDAATTATTDAELPECDRSSPCKSTFVPSKVFFTFEGNNRLSIFVPWYSEFH